MELIPVKRNLIERPSLLTILLILLLSFVWISVGSVQHVAAHIKDVVIQEIINRQGWATGNAPAIIITGNVERLAESFDGDLAGALRLGVEYKERTYVPTPGGTQPLNLNNGAVRFAVIGDYGNDSANEAQVATLIHSWNPDFVITTGDNNYEDGEAATIDDNIGKHYSQFIGNYQGSYGPGSPTNRFWPSLGNHDWHTITCSVDNCNGAYFDYFTLSNNERYYETDFGLVHLFALDSDNDEPDGRDWDSLQADWLHDQLAISTSCYKLVYFHHSPYSSGPHGSTTIMQWPFSTWGADAVLSAHDHLYERIEANGIPYFVNGAGGGSLYSFENLGNLPPEATSVVRYNEDHGAMLVTTTPTQITYQFYNAEGVLIDDYSVAKDCAGSAPTPSPTPTPTPSLINVPGDVPTIQAGIDLATDGDVVLVAPGHYYENILIAGKTITLASEFHTTGEPSFIEETIIDGGGATVINVDQSVGSDTEIIGFTIQNGDDGISASAKLHILNNRFTGNKDAIDYESGGGFCRNNIFENNTDDAIDLDGPTEVTIEDNLINNSGDDGVEVRLHPYNGPELNITIRRNVISGSDEDGIQLIGYDELTDRVFLIERNLIKDSAMVGLGLMDNQETKEDFRGASLQEKIHLFNNTFVDNDHSLTGGDNLVALNNIFTGSLMVGLKNVDGNSIAAYNLFWQNGIDHQNSSVDTATTILSDPLFDDNYLLMTGSPAIDAGTASFIWNSDVVLDLQTEEYAGTAPDLGAYESTAEVFVPVVLFFPVIMR